MSSDWSFLYSSFGDFILAAGIFMMLPLGKLEILEKNMKFLAIPISVLIVTISLLFIFDKNSVVDRRILLSSIKLLFYLFSTTIIYNFIKNGNLETKFLNVSNFFAVFTIVIGVIISISIYMDNFEIPNLLWTFTRQDYKSYYFAGNDEIVRMRSIFSEPAHLGYYLNTILFANVFSKRKKNYLIIFILSLGIFLTFSYSMIFILLITWIVHFVVNILKGQIKWSNRYFFILVPIIFIIYIFWDFFYITIVQRTINISRGADGSAYNRVVESWIYIGEESLLYGNGIGHTPPITNIFAYVLSDFGLVGFIPYLGFTLYLLSNHITLFVFFVMMNVAKGGYLNPMYWFFLLVILLFGINDHNKHG